MKLLKIEDAAKVLSISPWTLRTHIQNGKLRKIKIGRCVRLDERELERFIIEATIPLREDKSEKEENTNVLHQ